jgi:hypothetical protein
VATKVAPSHRSPGPRIIMQPHMVSKCLVVKHMVACATALFVEGVQCAVGRPSFAVFGTG